MPHPETLRRNESPFIGRRSDDESCCDTPVRTGKRVGYGRTNNGSTAAGPAGVHTRSVHPLVSTGGITSSSTYGSGHADHGSPNCVSSRASDTPAFNGFGGRFGEGSADGAAKGKRGMPRGYAPSNGGGVEAALSSNSFANEFSRNAGNVFTGRPSSRVTAPPGGHSTFSLQ